MTEHPDQDDRLDLEHRLDRVLTKYLDEKLHRWSHLDAGADRGDLASDLATAARAHFTSGAIDQLNENRGADPRVRICMGAAQLAEWVLARIAYQADGARSDVSPASEVGRELVAEVHEALGLLFAAGYNGLGDVVVPALVVPPGVMELAPTELTVEDKADPLGGAAVYLGEIAQQASYLRHTVATVDLPHVQAIQRAVDHADELVAAVRSMAAAAEVVPATPTAAAINEGLDRVLERVRTLALKDVERLNPRKLREAIDSLVWLEGQPGPLKPSLDEEPF